jgi:hypothetical protein
MLSDLNSLQLYCHPSIRLSNNNGEVLGAHEILQFHLISAFSYGFSPLLFCTTTDEQCNIVTYICCCSNFDEGDCLVSDRHKVCLELTQWVPSKCCCGVFSSSS